MPKLRKKPEQVKDAAILEMINAAQIRAGRPQKSEDLGKALGVCKATANNIMNNPGRMVELLRKFKYSYQMPIDDMFEYLRRAI